MLPTSNKGSIIFNNDTKRVTLSPSVKNIVKIRTPQLEKILIPKNGKYSGSVILSGIENTRSHRKLKLSKTAFQSILQPDNDHPMQINTKHAASGKHSVE